MAIDMTTVKQIMHNNKEVAKIEDGLGNILWQKQSAKVLQSITLSGQTTSLNRNAAFSFGGTVTAHYSDSSTADVTADTTFSGYNMSTSGTYTVTASYTEDGVTQTATYSLTVNPIWTTVYNNSTGYNMRLWSNKQWATTGVPCNISNKATKLRITYKGLSTTGTATYLRLNFNTSSNTYSATGSNQKVVTNSSSPTGSTTVTFDYTQGRNIVTAIMSDQNGT